jgi:hypothetical protein
LCAVREAIMQDKTYAKSGYFTNPKFLEAWPDGRDAGND